MKDAALAKSQMSVPLSRTRPILHGWRFPLWASLLAFGPVLLIYALGITINLSPSIPRGFYRMTSGPVAQGRLVVLCLPVETAHYGSILGRLPSPNPMRSCPGGYPPVIKMIAAVGGDTVYLHAQGLKVNGFSLYTWDRYYPDPGKPRTLPQTFQLKNGELWIHGIHPKSWDSRHFGPLPGAAALATAKPLWTFPNG